MHTEKVVKQIFMQKSSHKMEKFHFLLRKCKIINKNVKKKATTHKQKGATIPVHIGMMKSFPV